MMSQKTIQKLEKSELDKAAKRKVYDSAFGVVKWIASKLIFPTVIGFALWAGTYPVQYYSCRSYAEGKHFSKDHWDYRFFVCYVKSDDNNWYTQQEYQSSQIGAKLVLSSADKEVLKEAKK